MSWATVQEVLDITGVTVTTAQLAQAQGTVEVYANRVQSTAFDATVSVRDRAWLKRAVAWQAAWLTEQVDFTTRSSYDQLSQDATQHVVSGDRKLMLAPLAARTLRNLSWKGNRTVTVEPAWRRRGETIGNLLLDYTSEANDDRHNWDRL